MWNYVRWEIRYIRLEIMKHEARYEMICKKKEKKKRKKEKKKGEKDV